MPILIWGSGGKTPKLQTKTLTIPEAIQTAYSNGDWSNAQPSGGFVHTPDGGYDAFDSVAIKRPSVVHRPAESVECVDYTTLKLLLSSYYFTGIDAAKEELKKVFGLVVFHSAPNLPTGTEITGLYSNLLAAYRNSAFTFSARFTAAYQPSGIYVQRFVDFGSQYPTVTYDANTRVLTYTLPSTLTSRTDEYGVRFCTSGNYHAFLLRYE